MASTNVLLSLKVEALRKANDELEAKTNPRTITPEQINDFIFLTKNITNKIYIDVLVGLEDSETDSFARDIRNMLDIAGFGTNGDGIIRMGPVIITKSPKDPIFSPIPHFSKFGVAFQYCEKDNILAVPPLYIPTNVPIETIIIGLPKQLATFTKVGAAFSKINVEPVFMPNCDVLKPGECAVFVPTKNH